MGVRPDNIEAHRNSMTTQDLLEKFQWHINQSLENGLSTADIVLILEAIKHKIVSDAIKPPQLPKIVKANTIPKFGSPEHLQ